MTKKINQLAEKWDNTDRWVKRILGLFASIATIVGIVTGATN